jgi:MFS family permease
MDEKNRILSTVSLYHALNDGAISVVPILFPIFKEIYSLNYTQVGLITSLSLFVHLIAQLLLGIAADGKNSRTLLSTGILLVSVSMLLITQTQGFYTLLVFFILLRFSSSFFHPIGVGWISRTFKNNRLDWAMGIQSGFANLGAFIALSTTLFVAEITGWHIPIYIWALAGILSIITAVILTRNVDKKYLIVKKEKTKESIQRKIKKSINLLKGLKILIPALMISGSSWGIIITYLPLLLSERTELPLSYVGLMASVWIGVGCITSFFYGKIQSVIGRKRVITIAYFSIGIGCILLSFYTNVLVILGLMMLLGIAVFLTYPALASFISEVTEESVEGRTFGVIFTLQLGGGTSLIFIGGFLSDIYGIWAPFMLLGIPSFILSIILIIYQKHQFASKRC